jgi:threonine synthase
VAAPTPLLERYRELLGAPDEPFRISLGEGATPLVRARRLGAALGLDRLYLKFEGTNPTGSFKDRGMVLAVNRAVAAGARMVVCASTGNTSASAAAYAAASLPRPWPPAPDRSWWRGTSTPRWTPSASSAAAARPWS